MDANDAIPEDGICYHFTCTAVQWQSVFKEEQYRHILVECINDYRRYKGFLLYGLVIMLNHIHCIAAAAQDSSFLPLMQEFKKHTSDEIIRQLKKDNEVLLSYLCRWSSGASGCVWQKDGNLDALLSEQQLVKRLDYLHHNPVRKGYVLRPEDWKYSSARNWLLGDHSVISLDMDHLLKNGRAGRLPHSPATQLS